MRNLYLLFVRNIQGAFHRPSVQDTTSRHGIYTREARRWWVQMVVTLQRLFIQRRLCQLNLYDTNIRRRPLTVGGGEAPDANIESSAILGTSRIKPAYQWGQLLGSATMKCLKSLAIQFSRTGSAQSAGTRHVGNHPRHVPTRAPVMHPPGRRSCLLPTYWS